MSVDGFSMSSIGLPKDITSAQAALTSEQSINAGGEKVVGKIDRALNKKINNDEEKEDGKKNQYFNDGFKENEDENDEDNENTSIDKDEKITTQKAKSLNPSFIKDSENVLIKVNNKTNKIELYNKITNRIIESINANDFIEMINRLDYNSGILVNRSI